jgi:hypothetical protein
MGVVEAARALGFGLRHVTHFSVRHIVNAGAFYAYIGHWLGRVIGVDAALVALRAYSLMQIGLFGPFGAVASGVGVPRVRSLAFCDG